MRWVYSSLVVYYVRTQYNVKIFMIYYHQK